MTSTIKNSLVTLGSIFFLFLVWKILSLVIGAEIILPAPETTMRDLVNAVRSAAFWQSVEATVYRGLAGFLVSCLAGAVTGFLAGFNSVVFWALQPFMTVIRTTPVMSFILLALIWFRTELVPIFVSFLIAFPIIFDNVVQGIKNVDRQLVEMARLFRVKPWRILFELYIPSILPFLAAGTSSAMGLTWKVIIAAEILSQPTFGIGTQMQNARIYLETARILSWTVVIVFISFVFESILATVERKLKTWGE
ncbi:MAG TPA: ABC transporter permease subunit [Syntrophothermus lipocalidus]|uniref:Binding-protein-dependent transport systems inner membrane component n=1 Tax=Syntrophothermus lipocalidus (strain DSM 12680 / TGB-C1) TaxID=643648 RepID=D7CM65_SYNLT|nr:MULTISPECIES: ABC transporter permease subunit [Syntrophothermus]ADI01800.1 binding-protein-dependent transport systems inner membrane component [Syntrophothermus lipocalidus DSM 12680]NSW83689.1 ABC transporter permease subunit [Syntrophothermus sp.]HHV77198.1 ABC transporter permease subunit [Syntrophothermus lipocalidus]HOV42723.1 ABC transporter permease subunit [Syntrophothermus lipocalidus]